MRRYLSIGKSMVLAAVLIVPLTARAEPKIRTYQGIAYVSGGVSDDEQHALEAEGGRFNLKVTTALSSGHFVSDVPIQVQDAHGTTVLDVVADGPLLFAALPPGAYSVRCTLNGKPQEHKVSVGAGKQQQLACTWTSE